MPKVTIIQQVYNSRRYIKQVYDAIFAQSFKDIEVIAQIVSDDGGCKEYILANYPEVKILEPGYNIGFAKGHNEIFAENSAEFFQLINPDLILTPTYIEETLKAFEDPKVGAATGKLLRYDFEKNERTNVIDTTGVVIYRNGRARDRGQHEEDNGKYDFQTSLISVSGAGPMYRKAALEEVKTPLPKIPFGKDQRESLVAERYEYFDEDFHSYYEDVDLGWRMSAQGWKCVYVPRAVGYHGRAVGSSPGGYKKFGALVKYRKAISPHVRKLSYKNRILLFMKNSPFLYVRFLFQELMIFGFALVFEPGTLLVLPKLFRQMPAIWRKRKYILLQRKLSPEQMDELFSD